MLALNSQVLQIELSLLVLAGVLGSSLLELSKRHAIDGIENLMLSAGLRFEELNLDLALDLIFAQIGRANLHLVPLERSAFGALDLRFVDRGVLAESQVSVNDEETETGLWKRSHWVEHDDLSVGRGGLLLRADHNVTVLAGAALLIDQGFRHDLVSRRDDLVHLKLESTDEIVRAQIPRLVVIGIVDLNFEHLLLLKMEIDHGFGDELRVEIVVNDLCLANLLPHVSRLLEQDAERV